MRSFPPSAPALTDRRTFLEQSSSALGSMALAWLLAHDAAGADKSKSGLHHPAKAKRCIHIFSPGGVSHVDTFDYKPELDKLDGKELMGKGKIDTFFGKPGVLRKALWPFKQYGQSGAWVSDLFPHIATCVDDLAIVHSLVAKSSSHTPACFQMNTGFTLNGYPSLGAWLSYGLGSENESLPTFVVLPDPRGIVNGGSSNWGNGFLPAEHQGTAFDTASKEPVANLNTPAAIGPATRRASMDFLAKMNRQFADDHPLDSALSARLKSYELAAQMQSSIPEAINFADETAETQKLYGLDNPLLAGFGRNCLLARRLIQRGVRFVQLYNGGALGSPRINWDAHEDVMDNHSKQGVLLDQPAAALLKDLKRSGLLDDTLVFWSSEFGRTPFTEGLDGKGRDHHNLCFTVWLAGAGIKSGIRYGATDEVGYHPALNPTTVYDLHATVLHLLGIDHTKLTFYHNGIQRRLTDVHGHVVFDVLS
ncbi:MAG TPA: DUF1501 domain-containing protein [Pirellulaceae bacterium]|nr:DUF1501 domain-containing protein [Pirellulaceae bacterium]